MQFVQNKTDGSLKRIEMYVLEFRVGDAARNN